MNGALQAPFDQLKAARCAASTRPARGLDPVHRAAARGENSALTHRAGALDDNADAGVKLTRAALDAITLKQRTFVGSVLTGDVSLSGNPLKLRELFGLLDDFTADFEIVEPRKVSVD